MCLALIALLMVAYTVAGAIVRPAMYSDSGWGLLGWYTQDRASTFNFSVGPDPADIAREIERFMSTWTPGQHMLPGLIEQLGASLGLAIIAVVAIFSLLGLAGFYCLYRAFGFPRETVAVALLVIACNRFFSLPFTIYNGGEVLLFGAAPWFILMAWRMRALRWTAVPALVAGIAVLVFMKLSGIVLGAAVVGAAAICGDRPWARRDTIRKLLVAGVSIALVGATFYFAWFVRGATAASIATDPHPQGLIFYASFAVSSLWSASLSLLDLVSYLFLYPSRPVLASVDPFAYVFLPFAIATFAVMWGRLAGSHGEYLRFAFLAGGAMTACFLLLWMTGKALSFDDRHLKIPSLLLLVGAVHAFIAGRSVTLKLSFAAVAGLACLYGLASFVSRTEANSHYPMGERGVRQPGASPEAVAFIRSIDLAGPDARRTLIFLPSPEIALEVRHARAWANQADFESLDELKSRIYRGRVDRLYVFVQKRLLADGKAEAILRSFADYPIDDWTMVPLGDMVCFYQIRS